MKKIITAIVIQLFLLQAVSAQQMSSGVFTKCVLMADDHQIRIRFTVKNEINISYYTVEAGPDTSAFEIITRVSPKGNTVIPVNYQIYIDRPAAGSYRIRRLDMNGRISYSPVLTPPFKSILPPPPPPPGPDLAGNLHSD